MCGRFVQVNFEPPSGLKIKGENIFAEMPARYNLAPTQKAGVLLFDEGLKAERLSWRLIPKHEKELNFKYSTINARLETVATKWSFRYAFRERRCLIPMAGYYEWTETAPKVKQPWFVHRPDGETLWAAGIWEPQHWRHAAPDTGTFAIITTTARDQAGQVHDRMPVFLPAADAEQWMTESPEEALDRLQHFAVPPVEVYPVSRRVNTPKDDDPGLIVPIDLEAA